MVEGTKYPITGRRLPTWQDLREFNPVVLQLLGIQLIEPSRQIIPHLKQLQTALWQSYPLNTHYTSEHHDVDNFYDGFVLAVRQLGGSLPKGKIDLPTYFRFQSQIARGYFQSQAEQIYNPRARKRDPDPFQEDINTVFENVFTRSQLFRGYSTALMRSWEPIIGYPYRPDMLKRFTQGLLFLDKV